MAWTRYLFCAPKEYENFNLADVKHHALAAADCIGVTPMNAWKR